MAAPDPTNQDTWIDADGKVIIPDRRKAPRQNPKGGTSAADRRQFKRSGMDKTALLTELDEFGNPGQPWDCRLVDLSRGGMGLVSKRMVHDGRFLFVIVQLGPDRPRKLLCGHVRQCRYAEGQGYAIGVQFAAPPQTTPIKAWLGKYGFPASFAAEARPG